jgi:hypothetical protein
MVKQPRGKAGLGSIPAEYRPDGDLTYEDFCVKRMGLNYESGGCSGTGADI